MKKSSDIILESWILPTLLSYLKGLKFNLVQISKEEFLEMFKLGILNDKDPFKKSWSITSKFKTGKRKKRYISEFEYGKYMKHLKSQR